MRTYKKKKLSVKLCHNNLFFHNTGIFYACIMNKSCIVSDLSQFHEMDSKNTEYFINSSNEILLSYLSV